MSNVKDHTAEPHWLGPLEAARRLGVDRPTLAKLRESGLPHHRAGSTSYLYEANSLDAWLVAHECTARPRRMSRYARPVPELAG